MNYSRIQKKAVKNAWLIKTYVNPALVAVCTIDGENILTMCRGAHGGPSPRMGSRRGRYSVAYKIKHNIPFTKRGAKMSTI